jgi:hypothetical protein
MVTLSAMCFRFRWELSAARADRGGGAVEPAEKSLGAGVGRAHQHFGGRAVLGDLAAIPEQDMIGDVRAKLISWVTTIIVVPSSAS